MNLLRGERERLTIHSWFYRWDAQRIREQLQHEQLLKRYMQKESGGQIQDKKKEKLTTFQPKLEEGTHNIQCCLLLSSFYVLVEMLEIADKIVVSAFGRPLPKLPSRYVAVVSIWIEIIMFV